MKTITILSVSCILGIFCILPANAQKGKKEVQIKIIEDGKIKTDTSFAVDESVDKADIERISKILKDDDLVVFDHKKFPGAKHFSYEYDIKSFPDFDKFHKSMDSMMHEKRFFAFRGDSDVWDFQNRMFNDSVFNYHFKMLGDSDLIFPHGPGMHFYLDEFPDMPGHKRVEKHIKINTKPDSDIEPDAVTNSNDIIIQKGKKGEKKIIIKNSSPNKIIHKKIDDDTEIIIIEDNAKKDTPNLKPEKKESRNNDQKTI